MTPILVVRDDGEIAGANDAAVRLLGECVGKSCWDVVGGLTAGRLSVCSPDCTCTLKTLVEGTQQKDAQVRGERFRMSCSAVGDYVVVQLLETKNTEPLERPLSDREKEIVGLVRQGLSSPAIAEQLGIGVATVRTHVRNARDKLGARTRAEAVARALEVGEID